MRYPYLLIFLLSFFLPDSSNAQLKDTIYLMNGEKLAGNILDTSFYTVRIERLKKRGDLKAISIHKDLIFSVWYKDTEKIFYTQDTVAGNYFTPEEVRMFIYGQRDADKKYRNYLAGPGGFLVGAAGMILLGDPFLAVIPPFAYSAAVVYLPKIRIRPHTVTSREFLKYDTYIMGYEKVARKKLFLNALKGSFLGIAAGVTYLLLQ